MKNLKSLQKSETVLKKKNLGWFGHKTSEPIGFPKKLGSELTLRWSNTPWSIFDILSSFWVYWDTLVHWHIISRSYRLQWWSGWVWSAEQSLFVWAALFFFYFVHPLVYCFCKQCGGTKTRRGLSTTRMMTSRNQMKGFQINCFVAAQLFSWCIYFGNMTMMALPVIISCRKSYRYLPFTTTTQM